MQTHSGMTALARKQILPKTKETDSGNILFQVIPVYVDEVNFPMPVNLTVRRSRGTFDTVHVTFEVMQ